MILSKLHQLEKRGLLCKLATTNGWIKLVNFSWIESIIQQYLKLSEMRPNSEGKPNIDYKHLLFHLNNSSNREFYWDLNILLSKFFWGYHLYLSTSNI